MGKVCEVKRQSIEELLNEQRQRLLDLGCAEAAGMDKDTFSGQINRLQNELDRAPKEIPEGNIPVLIVVSANRVSLRKQMSLVKIGNETGFVAEGFGRIEPKNVAGVEIPATDFYLIYNVENGANMKKISPDDCVKQFAEQKRRELVDAEGVALVTHYSETLRDHYIDLPGTRGGSELVASLCLVVGRPMLDWRWAKHALFYCGSASCAIV